ncbi:NADP-dependent malic enzyme [Salmonella enterica subsp. enterica serovar Mississippi str. A4-633]|nr:NADP-dependent malic enzyme [Salmonella enterica subsp. enterica serovar Mississippi str. A4-633]
MDEQLKQSALDFHEFPVPGKIQVSPTKPLATQRDLALAYSPGVAAPCLEIEKDPLAAYKYTARGRWQPTNTPRAPRAATLSRSFPTVLRCWG